MIRYGQFMPKFISSEKVVEVLVAKVTFTVTNNAFTYLKSCKDILYEKFQHYLMIIVLRRNFLYPFGQITKPYKM